MRSLRTPCTDPLSTAAAISTVVFAAACSLSNPTYSDSASDSATATSGSTETARPPTATGSATGATSMTTEGETEADPSTAELKHYEDDDGQQPYARRGSATASSINVECFKSKLSPPFFLDRIEFHVRIFDKTPSAKLQVSTVSAIGA